MYIRKSTRRYKDKTYTNYVLVESVHTEKGPRQKAVCSLGDLGPRPREAWLKLAHKIETALIGQGDLLEPHTAPEVAEIVAKVRARENAARRRPVPRAAKGEVIAVEASRVTTERHREAGPVHVGYQFWQRLGLDGILESLGLKPATRRLACAIVMNRLIAPSSEHAMPEWVRRTALADILGADFARLGEDALYRTMDALHPHRAAIEKALAERERTLFDLDPTIYLYDLTSTYFEGQAEANPKAKRGYSRDKRPDCKQVVLGLAINPDGFPIAHEIFAGNTQDRQTLATMLDLLAERVGLRQGASVVIDRGMAYEENLAELRARKLHYIVASRQPERDQWLAAFADEAEGFVAVVRRPSPRNPWQKKTRVEVKSRRLGEETLVLCRSQERQSKDRAIREKHERRLLVDLDKLARRVAKGRLVQPVKIGEAIGRLKERYPRVARYWRIDYDPETKRLHAQADEDKRARAEKLDGCYILKTDRRDLRDDELWRIYSLLTRVENAFRNMKSPLAERPIFHQIERRVDTHIFLCVLAYHLLVAVEKTLLDKGIHTSWATVRERLKSHQVCTVVLPTTSGPILRIRKASSPEPEHTELYKLLDIPAKVMRQTRTWSETSE
jgi:transposase